MERVHCNRHEMEMVELMMFSVGILRSEESRTIDRIKMVKRGPQRFHTVLTIMENLLADIIGTISEGNCRQLKALQKNGRLSIKPQPVAEIPGYYLFPRETGNAILESCLKNECALCIKDSDEYPKCSLYKALIDVMPPDKLNKYICPYQGVCIEHVRHEEDANE